MNKIKKSAVLALIALILVVLPVNAVVFPRLITLPVGFQPEGIAVGRGSTFFTGSLVDGRILRGDLRTGESSVLVPGQSGMLSVGMAYDGRSDALFVAGGFTGLARVFDASSGELLASYQLAGPGNFINDVIVTREAAYFTSSFEAVLYRIPLGPGGSLPGQGSVEALPLSGGWTQVAGFNANGIEASSDGSWLIVVNSTTGNLYRVDPATGAAVVVDLGGQSVSFGDGLVLNGLRLFVVRNQLNQVAVFDLASSFDSGTFVGVLTSPDFNVPTTAAVFGDTLYVVNAKFGNPTPAAIPYEIVGVPLN